MSQNGTIFGLLGFAVLLAAGTGWGGYRVGYDRAALESKVELAAKEAELSAAKAAPAPRGAATGEGGQKAEKPVFAPTTYTAEQMAALVPESAGLKGEAQTRALYAFNNIVGACLPCADQQYSMGKCIERSPKLLDKSICANLPSLSKRLVRLAEEGRSPDEMRSSLEFSHPWIPLDVAGSPAKGPADAPITIIEYSDYQCPYCKKAQPSMKALQAKYGDRLRIVFMNQPLAMHAMARPAAIAAHAAEKQGKFWEYHDALFESEGIDEEKLVGIARALDLNMSKWESDRKSTEIDALVAADVARAEKWKITSTPTFFVNGYKVKGAQPPEFFERIIEAELADRG
jgi:predicted DsbA family dithiol-disulfide isomerase